MAFGRRRFTRAVVVRPPLDFTAAGGDATVTLLGAASVTLAAHAPTVTATATIAPPAATITLVAHAPTVTAGATIAAERGTISLAAHAPVATGSDGSATVNAEVALIVIAAIVPTVTGTGLDTGGADSYLVPTPFYAPPTVLDDDELVALTLLLV